MLTKDSILTNTPVTDLIADTVERHPAKPQTPYQVLQLLPKDATPEQQDSAIQSWFQPGEIHYSEQPDTLHLPGHDKGHNPREIRIPDYNKEQFLSDDSLYHPELAHEPFGVAGDPVPYNISNDDDRLCGLSRPAEQSRSNVKSPIIC